MKLPPEFDPIIQWWEKDGKKFALYALVVLVAVGSYKFWRYRQVQKNASASESLVSLQSPQQVAGGVANSGEVMQRVEALEKAVMDYKGTPSEPLLRLRLAKGYYAVARFEDAARIYAELGTNPPDGFADSVTLGEAHALEGVGNDAQKLMMSQQRKGEAAQAKESQAKSQTAFESALKKFDDYAKANTNSYLTLVAQLGAARVLRQLDRKDEAVKRLEALKEEKKGDVRATARIEATLDVVKRFVKREQMLPIDEINGLDKTLGGEKGLTPAPAPAAKPAPAPVAKPAPAAKPAAKPAAPAPAAKPVAKPAPAPAAKPAPAPVKK